MKIWIMCFIYISWNQNVKKQLVPDRVLSHPIDFFLSIVSLSWYQSNNMSDQVKKYSTTEVSEIQDNVKTLRVVCGTLAIFGKFKTNKKFTHFFVDEAGQAYVLNLLCFNAWWNDPKKDFKLLGIRKPK